MHCIIGLGNKGNKYKDTRHNLGWLVIDQLVERWDKYNPQTKLSWLEKKRLNAEVIETTYQDEKIILVKPLTMMNLSGKAIAALKKKYSLSNDQLIIIHDDKDLDFGHLKVKEQGSAGGHNGIKSVIEYLGTQEFARIKVGIENPKRQNTTDFVLGKFTPQEKAKLTQILNWSSEAVEAIITNGVKMAASRFN